MNRLLRVWLIWLFSLTLCTSMLINLGCAPARFQGRSVRPSIRTYIASKTSTYHRDRVALIFYAPSHLFDPGLASECTTIFHKAFLKHKVFKIVEPCWARWENEEDLMQMAAGKGYDILVQGNLMDFFPAQGVERSRAAASLKVYDLKTKVTLWYLDCALSQPGLEEKDWIFWKTKGQSPPSPFLLLASLAEEVAKLMRANGQ